MPSEKQKDNNSNQQMSHHILLFDGVCNLCNGYVKFVLRRDGDDQFQFGSLQSEAGSNLLKRCGLPTDYTKSLVLIEGSDFYTESSAVLRICTQLGGLYRLLAIFSLVSKFLRDALYRFVAEHRYKWFGKREQCIVPPPDVQSRFIDSASNDDDDA